MPGFVSLCLTLGPSASALGAKAWGLGWPQSKSLGRSRHKWDPSHALRVGQFWQAGTAMSLLISAALEICENFPVEPVSRRYQKITLRRWQSGPWPILGNIHRGATGVPPGCHRGAGSGAQITEIQGRRVFTTLRLQFQLSSRLAARSLGGKGLGPKCAAVAQIDQPQTTVFSL